LVTGTGALEGSFDGETEGSSAQVLNCPPPHAQQASLATLPNLLYFSFPPYLAQLFPCAYQPQS